jgi:hypothetical protein
MKSLIFGVYGNNINEDLIRENVNVFSNFGDRTLIKYHFPKLYLFYSEGTTGVKIIENQSFFLAVSGEWSDLSISFDESAFCWDIFQTLMNTCSNLFTLCLYNKQTDELLLGNDKRAIFPIFYRAQNNNTLLFSNEYQPLILFDNSTVTLDKKQMSFFFKYGFTTEGNTLFKNIKKLKHNQYLSGSQEVKFLEREKPLTHFYNNYDEWVEALHKALSSAVERLYDEYTEISMAITGGLDSRMVLGVMKENHKQNTKFITFPTVPLNETNDKDILIAKKLCETFSLQHNVVQHDERTEILSTNYFKKIRNSTESITITGQFGGEIMTFSLFEDVLSKSTQVIIEKLKQSNKLFIFKDYHLKKELLKSDLRWFYFEKLSSSFFTSIYGGTEGSWVHPWMIPLRFFSPFMDSKFLDVLYAAPVEFIEKDKDNLIFDIYDRYLQELKLVSTNSNKKQLVENGFLIEQEGIEPKKVKKMKTDNLFVQVKKMEGYSIIPSKFKRKPYLSKKENQKRIIDFCFWYEYISAFKY